MKLVVGISLGSHRLIKLKLDLKTQLELDNFRRYIKNISMKNMVYRLAVARNYFYPRATLGCEPY